MVRGRETVKQFHILPPDDAQCQTPEWQNHLYEYYNTILFPEIYEIAKGNKCVILEDAINFNNYFIK